MANLYLVAIREVDKETGKQGYVATYALADSIPQLLGTDSKEVQKRYKDDILSIQLLASDSDRNNPCWFYDARKDEVVEETPDAVH